PATDEAEARRRALEDRDVGRRGLGGAGEHRPEEAVRLHFPVPVAQRRLRAGVPDRQGVRLLAGPVQVRVVTTFLAFTVVGVVTGAIYAIAASGLVVTYTTSGIFNFAHGAEGMFMAFLFWALRVNRNCPRPLAFLLW